jgi:hypothetical protein
MLCEEREREIKKGSPYIFCLYECVYRISTKLVVIVPFRLARIDAHMWLHMDMEMDKRRNTTIFLSTIDYMKKFSTKIKKPELFFFSISKLVIIISRRSSIWLITFTFSSKYHVNRLSKHDAFVHRH